MNNTSNGDLIISGFEVKRLEYEEIILKELADCIDDCCIDVIDDDDGSMWAWTIENSVFCKYREENDFIIDMSKLKIDDCGFSVNPTTPTTPTTPT